MTHVVMKCDKIVKHCHNFPKPKVPSSKYLLCPTNHPEPKDIWFAFETRQRRAANHHIQEAGIRECLVGNTHIID